MAVFTGTSGVDTFDGTAAAADTFNFTVANLSFSDTVTGGLGTVNDTLTFTSAGIITQSRLANVSGIEIIRLFGDSSISLTNQIGVTSRTGALQVFGSNGDDVVRADAFLDLNDFVQYTAGTGSDTFVGSVGTDSVSIAAGALTQDDILIGGRGFDTIRISSAGTIAPAALNNVFGFELLVLNAGGNTITVDQGTAGSPESGDFKIQGGAGSDNVDASVVTTAKVVFSGGEGSNTYRGGGGQDVASGGSGADSFSGEFGNDVLTGNGGDDVLDGGFGDNRIDGGGGIDQLSADTGKSVLIGGAESDFIEVYTEDTNRADLVRYNATTDGGDTGDTLSGDLGRIVDGDLKFQLAKSAFNTLGNNFDKVFLDDGSFEEGEGNPADGADLVIYNDGGAGLDSVNAVDSYFLNRYNVANDVGAFLVNFDNTTNTTTIYYDNDAYSGGGVTILAKTAEMSAATANALANDFLFF